MRAPPTARRPDHRRRDRRRASSRSRSTWATAWRACRTRRSSASPRTSAARSATTRAASSCESTQSTPLQSGPIAGLPGRHRPALRRAGRRVAARRRGHAQPPVLRRVPPARRRASVVPVFLGDELVGFSVDHGAPPRPRRAHARAAAGSSTPTTPTPRACCSTRSRSRRRAGAIDSGWRIIADNTRVPELVVGDLEAQVAAAQLGAERFARARRAATAWRRSAPRPSTSWTTPSGCCAAQIEALPDGTYQAEGIARRLPRPSRPGLPRPADRGRRDGLRLATCTSTSTGTSPQVDLPINMPFVGTVDIAVHMTLRSLLLDTEHHEPVATNSGLFRPITISAPRGHARQPALPGADDRALLPGQHRGRHGHARARARCCPIAVSAGVGNLKVVAFSGLRAGGAGSTWTSWRAATAAATARTGSTPSTPSTRTRATTRSRTSSPTTRCGSAATSCATAAPAPGAGAAAWARSASSSSSRTAASRSRATATRSPPPGLFGGGDGRPARW